eukprot:77532-Alexandrium_andersonii.AAC.1
MEFSSGWEMKWVVRGRPHTRTRSQPTIGLHRGSPPCRPTILSKLPARQLRSPPLGRRRPHTRARTPGTH